MTDDKLSPQPEPTAEEPQLYPGGTDSLEDEERYGEHFDEPTARDLDPEANPAVEDQAPDEIKQSDEKQQEPEKEAKDQESGTTQEDSTAGQEDEEGDTEAPA